MTPDHCLLLDAAVGDKVKFAEETQAYTVQARDKRRLVCTKPFNPRRTVLYTIVDLEQNIRGPENMIFGAGAETREQCQEMIERLADPDHPTEISHRNRCPLNVAKFTKSESRYCGFCHRTRQDGACSMCVQPEQPNA